MGPIVANLFLDFDQSCPAWPMSDSSVSFGAQFHLEVVEIGGGVPAARVTARHRRDGERIFEAA